MIQKSDVLDTFYGMVKWDVIKRAEKIRLLVCDVDGVMSNGLVYMSNSGEELKAFNVRDGYGIRCLLTSNINVAIVTGRRAKLLEDYCQMLGIVHLYQGQLNKISAFQELICKLSLSPEQVSYIGDDLIDWPVMAKVGFSVSVSNAHPFLLKRTNYVTRAAGGYGAVRELCDLILIAQNKFENAK